MIEERSFIKKSLSDTPAGLPKNALLNFEVHSLWKFSFIFLLMEENIMIFHDQLKATHLCSDL